VEQWRHPLCGRTTPLPSPFLPFLFTYLYRYFLFSLPFTPLPFFPSLPFSVNLFLAFVLHLLQFLSHFFCFLNIVCCLFLLSPPSFPLIRASSLLPTIFFVPFIPVVPFPSCNFYYSNYSKKFLFPIPLSFECFSPFISLTAFFVSPSLPFPSNLPFL
jgi:hypothetical protein